MLPHIVEGHHISGFTVWLRFSDGAEGEVNLGGKVTLARYTSGMPEISRFLGIVIAMYYRDHAPPHFHAIYGDFEVTVEITSGQVNGQFPKRALAHVLEWSNLHRQELLDVWALARASRALPKIDPLE